MGRTWDNAIERLPHLGRNRCKNQMPPPGHSSPSCPTPLCRSRRFPLLSFPTFPPLLSFPTFLIGNPGVFPMQGHTNEKGQKKKTGFPLKTCGNDREERPAGDDREGTGGHDRGETCRHDRGETCRHDRRETCRHDRGTRRFCRSRRPPLSFPTFLPLLSFPTFLIGNPGVFPMQGHMNEKDKKNTGFPLKTCGNDREERPAGDDREGTSGHDRGETCRHDRRETCGHDRGTRRFRHSRRPPSVVPNVSPPSVVPDVFPPSVVPDVFNREPRIFPRRVG